MTLAIGVLNHLLFYVFIIIAALPVRSGGLSGFNPWYNMIIAKRWCLMFGKSQRDDMIIDIANIRIINPEGVIRFAQFNYISIRK